MRPIRLEVQGLTSFREKAEVDFSDLDLFAITGHTGAGKSSLVDAITYALFGEVPRVGDSIKQLISQGEDRLRVNLEFSADGGRYRVHRSTGHKGVPAVQMDHLDPATGEWLPDADKAREVNEHVASILGMDYDGFVRSVLLPQGQFQQFLAGKPEERRKVLDGLLRLDVYQLMAQRANQIADEHGRRASMLQQQLDTQYADATREALKAAKQRLTGLRAQAQSMTTARAALAEAYQQAESMSASLRRRREAEEALTRSSHDIERARETLETGEEKRRELERRIKQIEEQIEANQFDPDVLVALQQTRVSLENLEKSEKRLNETRQKLEQAAPQLEQLRAASGDAREADERATNALQAAQQRLEEARQENLAAALRRNLSPGDPCPVCGQPVADLPPERHAALDEAETAVRTARLDADRARERLEKLARQHDLVDQQLTSDKARLTELQNDCQSERQKAAATLGGRTAEAAEVKALIDIQEAARRDRVRLGDDLKKATQMREEHARALASAGQAVARLQAEIDARTREVGTASNEIAATESALREAAKAYNWPDVTAALHAGRDPAPALRPLLSAADAEVASANQAIGACETAIERITEGIEKAEDIRNQIDEANREGRLAADLASLLRVTRFPNYIREQSLRLLAQDGSRQLMQISRSRYEFSVDKQEFLVVDHWNVDDTRSVKTLSGGETFLASLALALALAGHLPGFGVGARTHTLESLFIDEGFSNLDSETLDIVTNALEEIGQDGSRMVGVVTHLPALAERMPARITVHKSQAGSTVTVD